MQTEDLQLIAPSGAIGVVLQAALAKPWRAPVDQERLQTLREGLRALGGDGAALDLRLARHCAHLRTLDLAELGYPSFRALAAERIPWRHTRLYNLIRLVESPLELIKRAVALGHLPISRAAKLPGRLEPEQQADWLAAWSAGPAEDREPPPEREVIYGEELQTVRQARDRARLLLGRAAPVRDLDAWILQARREGRSAQSLLEEARAVRPAPDPTTPSWPELADPADLLLGPWREPATPQEALAELDRLCALRSGRTAALGLLCEVVVEHALYLDLGYDTVAAFAEQELGLSHRTVQRYRKLGRALDVHPELMQAVRDGLHLDVALVIGAWSWSSRDTVRWLAISASLSVQTLKLLARETYLDGSAADRCREAIARAPAYAAAADQAEVGGPAVPAPEATATGQPEEATTTGQPRETTTTGQPARTLRVAFYGLESERREIISRGWVWVPTGLVEAARWLLDTVPVPETRGFSGETRRLALHRCQNPECRRRCLALEAHHVHFRSKGGADDPDNGLALCRSCHLRLVHTGRVSVKRVGRAYVWTWADRQTVVFPWRERRRQPT